MIDLELKPLKLKKYDVHGILGYNKLLVYKDERIAIADFDLNILLEPKYTFISDEISNGRIAVGLNGKYGFLNENLELVIPCIYDDVSTNYKFEDGIVAVKIGDKWGGIDVNGNTVIDFNYAYQFNFVDGLACVTQSTNRLRRWELINKNLDVLTTYDCSFMNYNGSKVLSINKMGERGYIDFDGKQIIPFADTLMSFNYEDRIYFFKRDKEGYLSKCGFYNTEGDVVVPPKYSDANVFSEGRASVRKGYRYAFIDLDGNVKTPFIYKSVSEFQEGLAEVQVYNEIEEKWRYTFIDKNGNMMFKPEFTGMYSFVDGYGLVRKKRRQWFVVKNPLLV